VGIVIRQSIKASIASYIGIGIGIVNTLFISLHFLSPNQVGLVAILFQASSFFAAFAQLGSPYVAAKFFPYFQTMENKGRGFLFFLLNFSLAGFIIFSILFFCFKTQLLNLFDEGKSPLLIKYAGFLLPFTFFLVFQSFLESYCRIHSRIVVPSIIREIGLRIFNAILIFLYGFNFISFHSFIFLLIGSYGLAVLFLIIYIKWLGKLYLKPDFSPNNVKYFKEMIIFGIIIVLGGLGSNVATRIDSMMLSQMKGESFVAIYLIAMFMAQVIEMPQRVVAQISTPIISKAWKDNQIFNVEEIYKKSATNLLIIGILLFLLIWCNIDEIFFLTPKSEIYKQGKTVVLCLGIAKIFDMGSGLHSEIIQYSKYFNFTILTVILLAILTIISNLIFIPKYGVDGAGYAYLISYSIYAIIKIIFLWVKYKIHPFTKSTLLIVILSCSIFLLSYLFHFNSISKLSALISIFIHSLFITSIFGFSIYKLKISPEVNNIVDIGLDILKKKLKVY